MALVASGPPKHCNGCGVTKRRDQFFARRTEWGIYAQSRCKDCNRTRNNNATYAAEYRERLVRDPERFAIHLDKERERMRRKRGTPPSRYRVAPIESVERMPLDPAPFAAWLRYVVARDESNLWSTAQRLGLNDKTFRNIIKGEQKTVALSVVEAALIADGTHLREVYPDLYEVAA